MNCKKCGSDKVQKDGTRSRKKFKVQQYVCAVCGYGWNERINPEPVIEPVSEVQAKLPEGMLSEEQLRQKHDMFFMVFSYVKKIPTGKYVEESQMLRELSIIGKPRYRDSISRPELKEYRGKVDGTIYYGELQSIKKLKNEGVLQ
jgi:ribosomal protein L37E